MTVTDLPFDNDDAYVWNNPLSWATLYGATSGVTDTTNPIYCGLADAGGGSWYGQQAFGHVDGSSIPDTDTVSSVVLSVFGDATSTPDGSAILEARQHTWTAPVDDAELLTGAELDALTLRASIGAGSWSTSARNSLTSEAGFAASFSKTGVTGFAWCDARNRSSSAPAGGENVFNWVRQEQGGSTTDTIATVTHAAAGGQATPELAGRPFGRRGQNQLHQALAF